MKYSNLLKTILTATILFTTSTAFAAIGTDAKLQYNKGIDYYNLGQFEEAAACFKEAVNLDPNYVDAYYNLGSILEYLNQDDAALSVFKQIILRKPDDYESVLKAAQLSQKLGETDKAKMYLSLIPKDSLFMQKAQILEKEIIGHENTTAQAQPASPETPDEQNQPENIQELKTENNSIVEVSNNTNGTFKNISSPTGVAADKEGNLYVAGFADNTIYKLTVDNKKLVYIKSSKIDGPIGLAIDDAGNIYIANYNKDNVLKVDTTGKITDLISAIPKPYCMFIANNWLYVSSQGSNSVIKFQL